MQCGDNTLAVKSVKSGHLKVLTATLFLRVADTSGSLEPKVDRSKRWLDQSKPRSLATGSPLHIVEQIF